MNWNELKKRIVAEYDSRNLKSNVRYNAIDKIEDFIRQYYPQVIKDVKELEHIDKKDLKMQYEQKWKRTRINGAESSVINEIYNQLSSL
ncbi:MAG: hypothetical protein OSJ55_08135 [Bacteroidales bacterium]|nr:hypothetical protein [Bacteroidales bacterium]